MAVPYTYLIGWSKHQVYYYGVRFAKDCHPDDLWESYFTSSKYVSEFVESNGNPDVIQIRKTFDNPDQAIDWESRVLKKMSVTKRDDFLNKWDGKHVSYDVLTRPKSEEYKRKMSEIFTGRPGLVGEDNPMYGKRGELSPHYNVPKTEKHREKIRNALLGKKYTEERCKNMSINSPRNSLGKKWYHDPETKKQKYFFENQQPGGWVLGRGR